MYKNDDLFDGDGNLLQEIQRSAWIFGAVLAGIFFVLIILPLSIAIKLEDRSLNKRLKMEAILPKKNF